MRKLMLAVCAGDARGSSRARRRRPFRRGRSRVVLALPAGGAVDALARILVEHMRATLGQPSSSRTWAAPAARCRSRRVVRAAPDGYTLSMGTLGQYVDLRRDLYAAVRHAEGSRAGRAAAERAVLDGRRAKTLPANNLRELVAWLKANPEGVGGIGRHRLAWRGSAGSISRRRPARTSSSCRIAAARRRCRISSPGRST